LIDTKTAIKMMLESSGKTQAAVAREIGLGQNAVSMAMKRDVKISTLMKIARACGFKVVLQSGDCRLEVDK